MGNRYYHTYQGGRYALTLVWFGHAFEGPGESRVRFPSGLWRQHRYLDCGVIGWNRCCPWYWRQRLGMADWVGRIQYRRAELLDLHGDWLSRFRCSIDSHQRVRLILRGIGLSERAGLLPSRSLNPRSMPTRTVLLCLLLRRKRHAVG